MIFKKKETYIGIDIGSLSIKAVEIEVGQAGDIALRKANLVPKEEGVKKALSGMPLKSAKVIVVVDCQTTYLRYFTIPKMSDQEVAEAIKWHVKEKVSLPLDELLIDHKLQEIDEAGVSKCKVKLAALPIKIVDSIVGLLGKAGIDPVALLQPPLAIEKLSSRMGIKGDETVAVVDIGYNYTGINIIKDNSSVFIRKINSGGAAITKALTQTYIPPLPGSTGPASEEGKVGLSLSDAEELKVKYGIPKEMNADTLDGKIAATRYASFLRPATERLLQEIERSLHYYSDESSGNRVNSLLLVGGGAGLKGLPEFLHENLGVPVSVGDPFKGMTVIEGAVGNSAWESNIFANAIGAALSEGRGINLLPPALKQKTIRTFEKAAVESVVAAVAVSLVLTFIGMRIQLSIYDKKVMYGTKELEAMKPQLEIVSHYESLANELSERKEFIETILAGIPPWKEALKEFSNRLPNYAVIFSLRAESNGLFIKGEIVGDVKNREGALSSIISSLEGGIFKSVTLINARMGEGQNSKAEFDIKCSF